MRPCSLTWQRTTRRPSRTHVCGRCQKIAWKELASGFTQSFRRILEDVEETYAELRGSPCLMCRMISSIKPVKFDGQKCSLYIMSASGLYCTTSESSPSLAERGIEDTTLLVLYTDERKHSRSHNAITFGGNVGFYPKERKASFCGPRPVDPCKVNYGLIRKWIQYCQDKHMGLCDFAREDLGTALRVIDCETQDITSLPGDQPYIALSYVWGDRGRSSSYPEVATDTAIIASSPLTIKDAILATKELGYRFLWVDKYVSVNSSADYQCSIDYL